LACKGSKQATFDYAASVVLREPQQPTLAAFVLGGRLLHLVHLCRKRPRLRHVLKMKQPTALFSDNTPKYKSLSLMQQPLVQINLIFEYMLHTLYAASVHACGTY